MERIDAPTSEESKDGYDESYYRTVTSICNNLQNTIDELLAKQRQQFPLDTNDLKPRREPINHKQYQVIKDIFQLTPVFQSTRYLAHMNSRLSPESLMGGMIGMTVNENLVDSVSSPVSSKCEEYCIIEAIKLVGYNPSTAHGNLTTGGTTGMMSSIHVATNIQTFPLSVSLAIKNETIEVDNELHSRFISHWKHNYFVTNAWGENKQFSELSFHELINLPINQKNCIKEDLIRLSSQIIAHNESKNVVRITNKILSPYLLNYIGEFAFRCKCKKAFPDSLTVMNNSWKFIVSESAHYSIVKALKMRSSGSESLILVENDTNDAIDLNKVKKIIINSESWIMGCIGIFGTTENSNFDDIEAIILLRNELEENHGISFFTIVDGAYGISFVAALRDKQGKLVSQSQLENYFRQIAVSHGFSSSDSNKIQNECLFFTDRILKKANALKDVDAITYDPHKATYIPYPSSVVLYKDKRSLMHIASNADYLWTQKEAKLPTGMFSLEGSRPGASAISLYFSLVSKPLNQEGLGKDVCSSIIAANLLYRKLKEIDGMVVNSPQSNILTYRWQNNEHLTELMLKKMHPVNGCKRFSVVETTMNGKKYFRTCIMHPHAINSYVVEGEEKKHVFDAFCDYLKKLKEEYYSGIDSSKQVDEISPITHFFNEGEQNESA